MLRFEFGLRDFVHIESLTRQRAARQCARIGPELRGQAMLSMTAFCRKQAELERGTLIWEIRSVNHRYLETSIRLPEAFRNLETAIRKTVRGRVKRGKVDCTLALPGIRGLVRRIASQFPAAGKSGRRRRDRFTQFISATRACLQALIFCAGPESSRPKRRTTATWNRKPYRCSTARSTSFSPDAPGKAAKSKAVIRERVGSIREILAEVRASLPEILAGQRQALLDNIAELRVDASNRDGWSRKSPCS